MTGFPVLTHGRTPVRTARTAILCWTTARSRTSRVRARTTARPFLEPLFPGSIRVDGVHACAFGLNAMSDGFNVVISDRASNFHQEPRRRRGLNLIRMNMSELLKAGGSVKCCTVELRA